MTGGRARGPALLMAVLLLLTGCSSGADGDTSPASPTSTQLLARPEPAGADVDQQRRVLDAVREARAGEPVPDSLQPSLATIADSLGEVGDCNFARDGVARRLCPRGDPDGDRTVVLFGNSHGRHWIDAVETLAQAHGFTSYDLVKPQCLAALVTPDERDGSPYEGCADFQAWALDRIAELQPDLVLVSSSGTRGTVYVDGEHVVTEAAVLDAIDQGHRDLFAGLRAAADRVVLLEDIPLLDRTPSDCLASPDASLERCAGRIDPVVAAVTARQVEIADESGVDVVATAPWFCWDSECPAVVDGVVPYRDDEHMTNEYSSALAEPLAAALEID